jgi:integrase
MSVRIKNGRWEYRFTIDGHEIRESTGLAAIGRNGKEVNRRSAEELEAQHRVRILEGKLGIQRLTVRSFSDAVDGFRHAIEVTRKAATAHRIMTSLVSAKVFFGDSIVSAITVGQIDNYKLWRLRGDEQIAPVKPVTVKHDLDALSIFFQWAVRQNLAMRNIVEDVERPSDKDAKREHVLSDAEEQMYFAAAGRHSTLHDFGRIIILQGMRPEEVERLCYEIPPAKVATVDGVLRYTLADLDARKIHIVAGKSQAATRSLRMTDETFAIIAARRASSLWVFASTKRPGHHITKLNCPHDRVLDDLNPCMSCGKAERFHPIRGGCLKYVSPERRIAFVLYDLRHTFSTRMIRSKVSIVELSKILGHSTIRITERYVHLAQEDMDSAMGRYQAALNEREGRRIVQ